MTFEQSAVAATGNGETPLTEVNKEPANPISSIWAQQFQQNIFWLNKPERNVAIVSTPVPASTSSLIESELPPAPSKEVESPEREQYCGRRTQQRDQAECAP